MEPEILNVDLKWSPQKRKLWTVKACQEKYTLRSGNNCAREKMNKYPDYDQNILRRNGKQLEECG